MKILDHKLLLRISSDKISCLAEMVTFKTISLSLSGEDGVGEIFLLAFVITQT